MQNADDVFATYAEFMLFDEGLIFKHNGTIPFSISDEGEKPLGHINSITSIGNSSKRENYNKIGKFGVGFKSVFTYTDTPEIVSINEAVELAKTYSDDDVRKMINGVLDKIYHDKINEQQ